MRSGWLLAATWPRVLAALMVVGATAGCGIEKQGVASVVAPSEFGLSVTAAATPDQLPRDGVSSASVTIVARNAAGKAVSGQQISVSPNVGSVSETRVTTDANGQASFGYTAPPASTIVSDGQAVISLLPIGGDAQGTAVRTVTLRLTGTPNTGAPVPSFTYLPAAPERRQAVSFDASATTDEGARCEDRCTYSWDFGGESTGSGRTVSYQFQQARTYAVTLTVTDPTGTAAAVTQGVTIVNPGAPTASFTTSPSSPAIQQNVNFVASASTAAAGHTITQYDWSFGDGSSSSNSNASTQHSYSTTGTYTVSLTVTDDVGQARTASSTITVVGGATANFTISPTNPTTGQTVNFNGGDSTTVAGATISSYEWDFGNGSTSTGSSATASTTYSTARTYTIRLTIRDSAGRTATVTKTVTVS